MRSMRPACCTDPSRITVHHHRAIPAVLHSAGSKGRSEGSLYDQRCINTQTIRKFIWLHAPQLLLQKEMKKTVIEDKLEHFYWTVLSFAMDETPRSNMIKEEKELMQSGVEMESIESVYVAVENKMRVGKAGIGPYRGYIDYGHKAQKHYPEGYYENQ
jgi:hypothetical protein